MTDEELHQQLLDFFRGEGRFTAVKHYGGMAAGGEDAVFWPYFDDLSVEEQERTVRLLAEIEAGRHPGAPAGSTQAWDLLFKMCADRRLERLRTVQPTLERDLSDEDNLQRWAEADDEPYVNDENYARSYNRAVFLYAALARLGSPVAARVWDMLIARARSQRFRQILHINRGSLGMDPAGNAIVYTDYSDPEAPCVVAVPSTADAEQDRRIQRDVMRRIEEQL